MKYFLVFGLSLGLGLLFFLAVDYINMDLIRFNGIFGVIFLFQWITQYILPWVILYYLIKLVKK